jgi:hypothetical protein
MLHVICFMALCLQTSLLRALVVMVFPAYGAFVEQVTQCLPLRG